MKINMAEVLKRNILFKEDVNNIHNFVCFKTKNGRRIISRLPNSQDCIPIDRKLKIASVYHKDDVLYPSAYDLLESYFTDGDVPIEDILITSDQEEAYRYLQAILLVDEDE